MTLGPASPFFIVSELATSIAFYRDTLGWDVRYQAPDENPFFAIVGLGAAQIFLKEIGSETAPSPNRSQHPDALWDAFIYTEDPKAEATSAASAPTRRDDGLFGFEVSDPDGYVLFFGRPEAS